MGRTDFVNALRGALNGKVPTTVIEDNVKYYEEYIDAELRNGKTEEEILQNLGEPRLLAKTIIEANKHAEETGSYGTSGEYTYEDGEAKENLSLSDKMKRWPTWLRTLLSVVGVALFIVIIGSLITSVLPVLILIFAGVYLYRYIRRIM